MSTALLAQLEEKIDNAIETIELLRLQVEELEEKNTTLQNESNTLKNRQSQWEQGLTKLLNKLDEATPEASPKVEKNNLEHFEAKEIEALA